jgi:hypothetical protein
MDPARLIRVASHVCHQARSSTKTVQIAGTGPIQAQAANTLTEPVVALDDTRPAVGAFEKSIGVNDRTNTGIFIAVGASRRAVRKQGSIGGWAAIDGYAGKSE